MAYRLAAPRAGSASVIILHGLGDSGAGWEFLAREFQRRPALSHVNFVLPSASPRPLSKFNGQVAPAWFDLNAVGVPSPEQYTSDKQGLSKALEYVKKLVSDEMERGVQPERIVVGGFSQGGALTMAFAATSTQKIGGLLSMSGFLPAPAFLESIASGANKSTPFLLTHGTADPMVPFKNGMSAFESLRDSFGFSKLSFEEFEGMPHTVDLECLETIAAFLQRVVN